MTTINKYNINHKEYKDIISFVRTKYNFDLSNYAYSIFKRRIEMFFSQYSVSNFDLILEFLSKEKFWKSLIDYITVPTTELFRDPEVWTKLKNKYFNKINLDSTYKIWIPDATSDDELFTLLIIINELSISNIEIVVTSAFEQNFDIINSYNIPQKKFEASKQNFAVYNPEKKLDDYFTISTTNIFLKKELHQNITFKKFDFFADNIFQTEFDVVLYRNRLLYYNPSAVNLIFDKIFNSLKNKGLFCIGTKESLRDWQQKTKFSFAEKECNILMKKK